jgi:2-desacetyl-2-hydroxyethyl bacteriochlorophyllide A dehydrogenase
MNSEAVLFTAKNRVEYGTVATPEPGSRDIVVATRHSWISNGTEGSFLRCERADGITPWAPGMPTPYPMVPGYQKVGRVEAVGREVEGFREGQWVFVTVSKCLGLASDSAGHIARAPADQSQVYALPEGADPVDYSGLVLTQVGYNVGSRPPVEAECHALVVGDGLVGHWAAQTLQARGARVAMAGRHDFRLGLWQKRPEDLAVNSRNPNCLDQAREWAGRAFDIVVDTVGFDTNTAMNEQLIPLIRSNGHFVTAGHFGHQPVDLKPFIRREITIHCPAGWQRARMEATLAQIHAGQLRTRHLITHRLPAREAARAWEYIQQQRETTLGVVLDWE